MSRNGEVDLDIAGETHRFRLGIGDLEALQEATDTGAAEHLHRLFLGRDYTFRHVREIIRVGLIGGGMPVPHAYAIQRTLDDMPTVEAVALATLVMAAALEAPDDERLPAGKSADPTIPMPNGKVAFAAFYGAAAIMKLPVADVRAMSLWQFAACVAGNNKANDPKAVDPLTLQEEDALWNWMNQPPLEGEPPAPEEDLPPSKSRSRGRRKPAS